MQAINKRAELRTPKHLTDRELWGVPASRSHERRMERSRAEAKELFDRLRLIDDRELELLFPGITNCRSTIRSAVPPKNGVGNVQPYELIVISTICNYLQPRLVFEFGTFNGLTTLHFAMNSPTMARVVSIDLDPGDPRRGLVNDDTYYINDNQVGQMFHNAPERARIAQVFADTTTFDHAAYRGKADLIFVDAGHEYDLVRSDTEKALAMLAPNGVILWHDYVFSHFGVYTLLNHLSRTLTLHSIPNTTLVGYQSSSKPPDIDSVTRALDEQIATAEKTGRDRRIFLNRIAKTMRRARKAITPPGSRRERMARYLLSPARQALQK